METGQTGNSITVRYFAGARAAAGISEEEVLVAGTLAELTDTLALRHGERLALVLRAASFLVDGVRCPDPAAPLPTSAVVDVLPPFAGG